VESLAFTREDKEKKISELFQFCSRIVPFFIGFKGNQMVSNFIKKLKINLLDFL